MSCDHKTCFVITRHALWSQDIIWILFVDIIWTWLGHDLDMIWTWFGHDLDMIWAWFGHDLDMIWTSFGHDLDMIWAWFGHDLGIIWTSFGHHLDIIWTSFGHHLRIIWGSFGHQFDPGGWKKICCEYDPGGEKWTCKMGRTRGVVFLFPRVRPPPGYYYGMQSILAGWSQDRYHFLLNLSLIPAARATSPVHQFHKYAMFVIWHISWLSMKWYIDLIRLFQLINTSFTCTRYSSCGNIT